MAPVNKEAIRILVLQHGQREAARIAGLNENTVRSWAMRYNWSTPTAATKTQPNGHSPLVDNVASELAKLERETRSSLARSAANLSRQSETAKLKDSANVHNVAKTAAIVHRWDTKSENTQNVVVNVALLGIDPASVHSDIVLDVDSEGDDSRQSKQTR